MKKTAQIIMLSLKVIRTGSICLFWYVISRIELILFKMPRRDNRIILVNKAGDRTYSTIILQFSREDDCASIISFFHEACEGLQFRPDVEDCEPLLRRFAKNRLSLVLMGTFY